MVMISKWISKVCQINTARSTFKRSTCELITLFSLLLFSCTYSLTSYLMQLVAMTKTYSSTCINPLNAELNSICHLLALLGAHHILHVSRIRHMTIGSRATLTVRQKNVWECLLHWWWTIWGPRQVPLAFCPITWPQFTQVHLGFIFGHRWIQTVLCTWASHFLLCSCFCFVWTASKILVCPLSQMESVLAKLLPSSKYHDWCLPRIPCSFAAHSIL